MLNSLDVFVNQVTETDKTKDIVETCLSQLLHDLDKLS